MRIGAIMWCRQPLEEIVGALLGRHLDCRLAVGVNRGNVTFSKLSRVCFLSLKLIYHTLRLLPTHHRPSLSIPQVSGKTRTRAHPRRHPTCGRGADTSGNHPPQISIIHVPLGGRRALTERRHSSHASRDGLERRAHRARREEAIHPVAAAARCPRRHRRERGRARGLVAAARKARVAYP